jgi:predicted regulator of Ras-like GTPase activity (Roadblock/LC7/MglB family)
MKSMADMQDVVEKHLRTVMTKIIGINQMIVSSKKSGCVIAAAAKFARKENIENVAALSSTLYQLSQASEKPLDSSIFEFATGEKLFTIMGNDVILSAVSDASVQMGISRMYLKKFADGIDKVYKKAQDSVKDDSKDNELANIFRSLSESN